MRKLWFFLEDFFKYFELVILFIWFFDYFNLEINFLEIRVFRWFKNWFKVLIG